MAKREKKGAFGAALLSVSKKYIFPDRRRAMMAAGGLACLALAVFFALDFLFIKSSLTSSGPLSSYHATFEKQCETCHDMQTHKVSSDNCKACHEKVSRNFNLDVYTLAAHYVYRSDSTSRSLRASEENHLCHTCHPEHLGRETLITVVPDSRCTGSACHNFGSLTQAESAKRADGQNKLHPQFDFIAESIPDDSTLKFTHVQHVGEVRKLKKFADIELACLYCHNPQPDGKHFDSIEFDKHCDVCHLGNDTPRLPVKTADSPGVEKLATIRERRRPGTAWAFYTNPNEFKEREGGTELIKSPVYHEDPWILENLKMIRETLYPDRELSDLLKTSITLSSPNFKKDAVTINLEAIQTLQDYVRGLRGQEQKNVQNDLDRIEAILATVRKRLRDQPATAADIRLLIEQSTKPTTILRGEYRAVVDSLTIRCQECHMLAEASIARVRKEQNTLMRAEFDHRAHVLHRRCLECHTEIPITVVVNDTMRVNDFKKPEVKKKDRSVMQNLPSIDNCTECHNPSQSSNKCVTCHYFHPNKTMRSKLLLYLD
jgi:hypothetical protein